VLTALATGRFYSLRDHEASAALLPRAGAISSVVFTMLLAWHALPTTAVALAWGALALVLLQLGTSTRWTLLTDIGYAAAAATFARLLVANVAVFGDVSGLSTRVLTVAPSVGLFLYLSARAMDDPRRYGRSASRAFLWMAAVLVVALIRFELGRVFAAAGWSLTAVVLLVLAKRWRPADLRAQAYIVGAMAFVRGWTTSMQAMPVAAGVGTEVLAAVVVAGGLYASEFLAARPPRGSGAHSPAAGLFAWIESHAREGFAIAATLLLASVLFHNVSPSLLTVAWALLGLSLLVVGFGAREAVLRRSGLVLLAMCIAKVLAYDSRQLETVSRIFSFILLGLVLMLVSYLYTRFGATLRKYL
jgi:hypothetical protein